MENGNIYYATGKRKSSIAKTWLKPGSGKITVNTRSLDDYFPMETAKELLSAPLVLTDNKESFDINIRVLGGGIMGQAGAVRHGIAKALVNVDPDLRAVLKKAGFLTRDARIKERKKYGQKGARANYQFSKR
ncbi:30S ribosomal subunit protein S9 [Desulfamplus magnetovallimortis]|uniref:Small ribosomal subunit protein uS9 n=1 Tax=Desulfamplus magnetovallimortis TaxID=1246637 RepID=A0A1W1HKP6_9BACT|nr:30S ribosomal protein S9 [Desulfamplus magnetovallimortis]SLM32952.1 30S ribosomal subunit protein S9 [Desulfamplus magnetovallimortis]